MEKAERDAAVRRGIEALPETPILCRFWGLMTLRTVAEYQDLPELHAELVAMMDEIGVKL